MISEYSKKKEKKMEIKNMRFNVINFCSKNLYTHVYEFFDYFLYIPWIAKEVVTLVWQVPADRKRVFV